MPDFTNPCPEVDKRWNGEGQIDLSWLERHVKTCRHCQNLMRLANQVSRDILDEVAGEEQEPSRN